MTLLQQRNGACPVGTTTVMGFQRQEGGGFHHLYYREADWPTATNAGYSATNPLGCAFASGVAGTGEIWSFRNTTTGQDRDFVYSALGQTPPPERGYDNGRLLFYALPPQ